MLCAGKLLPLLLLLLMMLMLLLLLLLQDKGTEERRGWRGEGQKRFQQAHGAFGQSSNKPRARPHSRVHLKVFRECRNE